MISPFPHIPYRQSYFKEMTRGIGKSTGERSEDGKRYYHRGRGETREFALRSGKLLGGNR